MNLEVVYKAIALIIMYLVVSTTDKYQVEWKFRHNLINAMTIGHEIHITRPILLILLSMNLSLLIL